MQLLNKSKNRYAERGSKLTFEEEKGQLTKMRTKLLAFSIMIVLLVPTYAQAKEPIYITYQQAGCNLTTYLLTNAEADQVAMDNFHSNCSDESIDEVVEQYSLSKICERYGINNFEAAVDLLARAIWNETGILGTKSMYYTGSVILNRIKSDLYANTLYGVIYQKGQYEITWTGLINRQAPEEAHQIARDLLINGSVLPENVLFQAQFTQGSGVYAVIGNTYYCYM